LFYTPCKIVKCKPFTFTCQSSTFTFHVMYISRFIFKLAQCACIYSWNTIIQHHVKYFHHVNVTHSAIPWWGYLQYPLFLQLMVCDKMRVLHFTFFISSFCFLLTTRQDRNDLARWQKAFHLKQFANEAYNNVKSSKMTMTSSFKLTKIVNGKEQHRRILNPKPSFIKPKFEKGCKIITKRKMKHDKKDE